MHFALDQTLVSVTAVCPIPILSWEPLVTISRWRGGFNLQVIEKAFVASDFELCSSAPPRNILKTLVTPWWKISVLSASQKQKTAAARTSARPVSRMGTTPPPALENAPVVRSARNPAPKTAGAARSAEGSRTPANVPMLSLKPPELSETLRVSRISSNKEKIICQLMSHCWGAGQDQEVSLQRIRPMNCS